MIAVAHNLRTVAAVRWPRLNHKGRQREISRHLLPAWSPRRVRSVYNAEPGVSLRAGEADDIKALIGAETETASGREDRLLAQRVAELEARLAAVMAALARDEMAAGGVAQGAAQRGTDGGDGSAPRRRSTD